MSEAPPESRVRLVVVTGSGRSGTSTVAGALKRLGLHVPQPEMPADETNPRGFYEPIWVVDFHKRLLNSIPARTNDARPRAAADVAEAAAAPEVREELRTWLAEHVAEVGPGGQLVIKDPRAFWAHELWTGVADELGIELSYLTMLRHPTEVLQSRETYYLSNQTDEFRRTRQTANLAGWVNSAYETEVATRSRKRTFVRYTDLLEDWRTAMGQAQRHLGMSFNADLSGSDHHDVDDFIDAKLYRSKISWDDVDTIPELREQATSAWDACNTLVDAPYDDGAIATLEDVHQRYVVLHQYAEAIALDHTNRAVAVGRRDLQARNADLRKRLNRRRNEVERLRGEVEKSGPGGSRLPWKR
ncbi:sulfotransferase family protein [Nocardioides sp. URHA0032]|uniref:sulfotransferase family protein n=1 Tax=Nocardioides sp. URHA0032 TaxID=1380388 RepID=UPI00048FCC37|nr:sulfotransferase [Nocardioides sp. URHA0032]